MSPSSVVNRPVGTPAAAMSIDVEDWFQVENLKSAIRRDSWDSQVLRVEQNTDRMLELLDTHDAKSTFFVLGWVAERCPHLVRRIAEAGHEVASHGYGHELIYDLTPAAFREDVLRANGLLEDITGAKVRGYRAPSFSITDWAVDILLEVGVEYDSSAFRTIAHDRYGKLSGLSAGQPVIKLRSGFTEVSVSSLNVASYPLPWGGGGYFRMIPYPIFSRGVRQILRSGTPYVFYIHPWEIDEGQPRVPASRLKRSHRLRHYVNIDRCEARWTRLLADFAWITIADLLNRGVAA
jgi:polysaccharide deacetylase family protein (PEP-CTERM system associated)